MFGRTHYSKLSYESSDDARPESEAMDPLHYPTHPPRRSLSTWLAWFLFLSLACINLAYISLHPHDSPSPSAIRTSPMESLLLRENAIKYKNYPFDNGFGEHQTRNGTEEHIKYAVHTGPEVDENWLEIFYELSRLRFTAEEAEYLGLNTSMLPDGSYMASLDVFHQLHCLDILRQALSPEYYHQMEAHERTEHLGHCINYLRQSVMCNIDFTPLEYHDVPTDGPDAFRHRSDFDGTHTCNDWGALYDWAMKRRVKVPEEWNLIHYPKDQGA